MSAKKKAKPPRLTITALRRRSRVISVFGPFAHRTLVEMPTDLATALFPSGLGNSSRTDVIDAVEREIADLRKRSPELADSALAASALAMAYEIAHPYNSATSKSMCARVLREAMDRLRELAPEAEEKDTLDELSRRRTTRRAAG